MFTKFRHLFQNLPNLLFFRKQKNLINIEDNSNLTEVQTNKNLDNLDSLKKPSIQQASNIEKNVDITEAETEIINGLNSALQLKNNTIETKQTKETIESTENTQAETAQNSKQISQNTAQVKSTWLSYLVDTLKIALLVFAFCIALVLALWYALPKYPTTISHYLSKFLHMRIEIGSIKTGWGQWQPKLQLNDISVWDKQKKVLLFKAKSFESAFKYFNLDEKKSAFKKIALEQAFIQIEQINHKWYVLGHEIPKSSNDNLPSTLFGHDAILIKNGHIRLKSPHFIQYNQIIAKQNPINLDKTKDTLDIYLDSKIIETQLKNSTLNSTNTSQLAKQMKTKVAVQYQTYTLADVLIDSKFSPRSNLPSFVGYFKDWEGALSVTLKHDKHFLPLLTNYLQLLALEKNQNDDENTDTTNTKTKQISKQDANWQTGLQVAYNILSKHVNTGLITANATWFGKHLQQANVQINLQNVTQSSIQKQPALSFLKTDIAIYNERYLNDINQKNKNNFLNKSLAIFNDLKDDALIVHIPKVTIKQQLSIQDALFKLDNVQNNPKLTWLSFKKQNLQVLSNSAIQAIEFLLKDSDIKAQGLFNAQQQQLQKIYSSLKQLQLSGQIDYFRYFPEKHLNKNIFKATILKNAIEMRISHLSNQALLSSHATHYLPAFAIVPAMQNIELTLESQQNGLAIEANLNKKTDKIAKNNQNTYFEFTNLFTNPTLLVKEFNLKALLSTHYLDIKQASIRNHEASLSTSGMLMFKHNNKPVSFVDLKGQGQLFGSSTTQLNTVLNFLPILGPPTLNFIKGHILQGKSKDIKWLLQGDMHAFPFVDTKPIDINPQKLNELFNKKITNLDNNHEKLYSINKANRLAIWADITEGQFKIPKVHEKEWPLLKNIQTQFMVYNHQLALFNSQGFAMLEAEGKQKSTVAVSMPKLIISDVMHSNLNLDLTTNAPLSSIRDFVYQSPLQDFIGQFAKNWQAQGNSQLNLMLNIPLPHAPHPKNSTEKLALQGQLLFNNNHVDTQLSKFLPPLTAVNGAINFNQNGFTFNGLSGNILSAPIELTKTNLDKQPLKLQINSIINQNLFNQYTNFLQTQNTHFAQYMPNLLKFMQLSKANWQANTPYQLNIELEPEKINIQANSQLQGFAFKLANLQKQSTQNMPLNINYNFEVGKQNSYVNITLPQIAYLAQLNHADDTLNRSMLQINTSKKNYQLNHNDLPTKGMQIRFFAEQLIANDWLDIANHFNIEQTIDKISNHSTDYLAKLALLPNKIYIFADDLVVNQQSLNQTALVFTSAKQANLLDYSLEINHALLHAYIALENYKPMSSSNIQTKVKPNLNITLEQINLQAIQKYLQNNAKVASVSTVNTQTEQAKDWNHLLKQLLEQVNLKVSAKKINLFNHSNTQENTQETNENTAKAQLFLSLENDIIDIKTIRLEHPLLLIEGSGKSTLKPLNSSFNLDLTAQNVGELLSEAGYAKVMQNGTGKLNIYANWPSGLIGLNKQQIQGTFNFNIKDGLLLQVDPAIAKLLGIFSLQSLGKIITFNWSSLFSKGSPFNNLGGHGALNKQLLKIDNLVVKSPQATVYLKGDVNLKQESQNLVVDVYPKIDATSAALAYAVINPALGLGTLLAQYALAHPLGKVLKQQYIVTGSWDKPLVDDKAAQKKTDTVDLQER